MVIVAHSKVTIVGNTLALALLVGVIFEGKNTTVRRGWHIECIVKEIKLPWVLVRLLAFLLCFYFLQKFNVKCISITYIVTFSHFMIHIT
jgi:hypothetical protein